MKERYQQKTGSRAKGEKLGEFRYTYEDALEDLKAGIELAWDSLGVAVKSATSRFTKLLFKKALTGKSNSASMVSNLLLFQ